LCCNAACTGACQTCSAALGASADGTCTPILGNGNPSCSPYTCGGGCGQCNAKVLLVGDDFTQQDPLFVTALQNEGMTVTYQSYGVDQYTGNPSAGTFDAVVVLVGNLYYADMPLAGQQSIVQAAAARTGIVFSEWATLETNGGRWQTLGQDVLLHYENQTYGYPTFVNETNHEIWTGLPSSFALVNYNGSMYANDANAIIHNGVRIAGSPQLGNGGGPAVVVRDDGTGRIVHINTAGNYYNGYNLWTNDANLKQLFVNSTRWAAHCCVAGPNRGSCPTACSTAAGCQSGFYCSSARTCQPTVPNGAACTAAAQCTSGFCVDGVCCNSACGGGATNDCQACSTAAGAPTNGTCATAAAGTLCRPAAGSCDAPEVCDGSATACPADVVLPSGTVCRPIAGPCDAQEACDGMSGLCPADAFATGPGSPSCAPYLCVGAGAPCPTHR
jgi:hypothetical protein